MALIYANPNPDAAHEGDCVVRAVSLATGRDWERTYIELAVLGFQMADMPSSNEVWSRYQEGRGFTYQSLRPGYYTVRTFCEDHPYGLYVLATGTHVVMAWNGNYYDTWDSGDETLLFYFVKEM